MPGPEKDNPLLMEDRTPPARSRRLYRWVIAAAAFGALLTAGGQIGRHAWAAHHVRAAEQALQRWDFANALDHLEQALRIGGESVSTRLQAARAARRSERFERAEGHLSACEKKGARMESALERIMLRAQRGDLAETERPLERLIVEGHPDTVLLVESLARGYLQIMRMGSAHSALNDLIKRDPNHALAYFLRAGLYERLHRTSEALPDYRRAVELAPGQDDFRLGLALALLQAGQTANAGPHVEELVRQRPSDPRVLLGVARYYRACALPERALEYLDRLLQDQPESAEGWAQRGRAYRDLGNSTEAVRCLRKAFELSPRSYAIGFELYTELYGLGHATEAKAIEKKVEYHRQQDRQVERLFFKLEHDRNSASLRHEIGMIYLRNQEDETAVRWLQSALQVDPSYPPTHAALADYYQRQGNAQAATFHRQRAGTGKP
jgi:Tfp pilus assembly protein PilF